MARTVNSNSLILPSHCKTKLKGMRIALFLLHVSFYITVSAQTETGGAHKEYHGEHFRIQYPVAWEVDASKKLGAELFLFSPLEDKNDKFRENVNVLIQELEGQGVDIVKYKEITDKQLIDLGTNAKVYESVVDTSVSTPEYRVSYMMIQQGYRLRIISKCFIKDDKAYLVTFTAEFDKFDKYKAEAKKIIETFELKN
jgi:hypothetical protein